MGLICENEDDDKWRLVFDATVSGVDPRVWLPEATELPGIQDLLGILQTSILGDEVVGLKIDVKSAFRRIKLRFDQCRKNVVVINGKFYFYKTMPFGCKISAYWWQRIAGLVHRIIHNILGPWIHAGLVYVDDSIWIFPKDLAPVMASIIFLVLDTLGMPLSYHKTIFASMIDWVGYTVNPSDRTVSLPELKISPFYRRGSIPQKFIPVDSSMPCRKQIQNYSPKARAHGFKNVVVDNDGNAFHYPSTLVVLRQRFNDPNGCALHPAFYRRMVRQRGFIRSQVYKMVPI